MENIQSAFLVNDSIVQNFKNILKNDLDVTILSTNLSDLDATQNTIVNWTDHRTNESAQFLKGVHLLTLIKNLENLLK